MMIVQKHLTTKKKYSTVSVHEKLCTLRGISSSEERELPKLRVDGSTPSFLAHKYPLVTVRRLDDLGVLLYTEGSSLWSTSSESLSSS